MKITVNGETENVQENITISALLTLKKVDSPELVSVQVNGNFIDRATFDTTALHNNDTVDFLYFMGGGC